jgi:hypothetical protein
MPDPEEVKVSSAQANATALKFAPRNLITYQAPAGPVLKAFSISRHSCHQGEDNAAP